MNDSKNTKLKYFAGELTLEPSIPEEMMTEFSGETPAKDVNKSVLKKSISNSSLPSYDAIAMHPSPSYKDLFPNSFRTFSLIRPPVETDNMINDDVVFDDSEEGSSNEGENERASGWNKLYYIAIFSVAIAVLLSMIALVITEMVTIELKGTEISVGTYRKTHGN